MSRVEKKENDMKLKFLVPVAAALTLICGQASGTTLALDFNSLPSAQGWQFVGQGVPETSAFSVDGTTLRQNTTGSGFSGWAYYQIPNIVDVAQGYSIEVRARVISEEFSSPGAFSFAATDVSGLGRFVWNHLA